MDDYKEEVIEKNYFEASLFNKEVKIFKDQMYEINKEGQLLNGFLAEPFVCENTKAKFTIPKNIQVIYDEELGVYVFKLDERLADVESEHVSYKVHGYILFNEKGDFTGRVAEDVHFYYEGREIIFLINDNPEWSDTEEFNYSYYSKNYRDKIEHDIIAGKDFLRKKDLEMQFAAHDGYGMQIYRGENFLVYFQKEENNFKIEDIHDENDIIKNFKAMNVGRPFISSYKKKLVIPLDVLQPDESKKSGYIELIMTNDTYENMKAITENKKEAYLVFRMGMFDDFSTSGFGILYFSYDQEQYENIINTF